MLDLTGSRDPYFRSNVDVLSYVVTEMRHKSDKKARGEYHTPPEVCQLMAHMLLPDATTGLDPGFAICEPTVGTGGMFRAAAQRIRELELNPHDAHWYACDIDPIAAACAAVNAIVWDLGPNVAIRCADTLAEPDWTEKAREHRKAVIAHRDQTIGTAHMIAAWSRAAALLDKVTASSDEKATA